MVQSYSPGGENVLPHESTLAPPGEYHWTSASFSPPESTTQIANRSAQPFLHSSQQKVPILYNGRPFPPKFPLPMGRSGPPSNTWFHGSIQAKKTKWHLNRFSHFCTDDRSVPIPYNGMPLSPSKLPLPTGDLDPHLIRGSLGPPQALNPSGISISSAVFAELTSVTDRQTDRPTHHTAQSVTTGCIYINTTPMPPNNTADKRRINE